MRALRIHETGGPDAVLAADVPEPDADGALIVDVRAAGVGFADLLMSRGEFQIRQEPPFTLGWEAAGVVRSAPEESAFSPGDEVVTLSFGAFAEQVAAVPEATFALPAGLDFAEGAAFPMNYLTALAALERRGRLRAGETLLVLGAGGGTGTAAVQVGKALGARVIAAVSSEDKAGTAREAGADETVLTTEGWRGRVLELAPGGVNVVFDPVGGERFHEALRCLASEGRLVVVGFADGAIPEIAVNRLLLRDIDVCGCKWSILATAPGRASRRRRAPRGDDRAGVRPPAGRRAPRARRRRSGAARHGGPPHPRQGGAAGGLTPRGAA